MTVVVPNALALTSIADGAAIVASDHRNNYASVQVGVNGLIAMFAVAPTKGDMIIAAGGSSFDHLPVGSNGQVLTADSAQTLGVKWAAAGSGSELAYQQVTAGASVIVAVEASAQTLFTLPATTFDGAPVVVDFFCPLAQPSGAAISSLFVALWEGAAQVSRLAAVGNEVASNNLATPLVGQLRFTPSAAAHTYIVKAFAVTGAWTLNAGAGSGAAYPPMFARITKV